MGEGYFRRLWWFEAEPEPGPEPGPGPEPEPGPSPEPEPPTPGPQYDETLLVERATIPLSQAFVPVVDLDVTFTYGDGYIDYTLEVSAYTLVRIKLDGAEVHSKVLAQSDSITDAFIGAAKGLHRVTIEVASMSGGILSNVVLREG